MRHISPVFLHRKGNIEEEEGKKLWKKLWKNYILLQLCFMTEGQNSKHWTSALPQGRGWWNIFLTNKASRHLSRTSAQMLQFLVVWLPPWSRSFQGLRVPHLGMIHMGIHQLMTLQPTAFFKNSWVGTGSCAETLWSTSGRSGSITYLLPTY